MNILSRCLWQKNFIIFISLSFSKDRMSNVKEGEILIQGLSNISVRYIQFHKHNFCVSNIHSCFIVCSCKYMHIPAFLLLLWRYPIMGTHNLIQHYLIGLFNVDKKKEFVKDWDAEETGENKMISKRKMMREWWRRREKSSKVKC